MNPGKVTSYVLLSLLVVLVIVIIVLTLIKVDDEHEFIQDLKKIKVDGKNELMRAACSTYAYCHSNKKKSTGDKICSLPIGLQGLYRIIGDTKIGAKYLGGETHIPIQSNPCTDQKLVSQLNKTYSFSKLEAKQIYDNNNLIIDDVYNNKNAKECFKEFIKLIGPDLGTYFKNDSDFENQFGPDKNKFLICYRNLDTRRQKYINMIIEGMLKGAVAQLF